MNLPECLIDSVKTLRDGTCKITLEFQEMSPEKMTEVFLARQSGQIVSPNVKVTDDPKTPSERLRGVLYVCFKETNPSGNFNDFYQSEMTKIIEHYKSKLN